MRKYYGTVCVAAVILFAADANAVVRYVDVDATGQGDGTNWCDAFTNLRSVLQNTAQDGDEIRVAEGTYRPVFCLPPPIPCNFQGVSFVLKTGVTVTGGWAGCGEPDPDERDIVMHLTILSGDILGDDNSGGNNSENSYHVVTAIGSSAFPIENAILDGFTITAGNAGSTVQPNGVGGVSWPLKSGA